MDTTTTMGISSHMVYKNLHKKMKPNASPNKKELLFTPKKKNSVFRQLLFNDTPPAKPKLSREELYVKQVEERAREMMQITDSIKEANEAIEASKASKASQELNKTDEEGPTFIFYS